MARLATMPIVWRALLACYACAVLLATALSLVIQDSLGGLAFVLSLYLLALPWSEVFSHFVSGRGFYVGIGVGVIINGGILLYLGRRAQRREAIV